MIDLVWFNCCISDFFSVLKKVQNHVIYYGDKDDYLYRPASLLVENCVTTYELS